MNSRSDDFAKGRATAYRTALLTVWQELQTLDPRLQARLMNVCRAGLENKFDTMLPSSEVSDEFLHGLCDVQGELGLLPPLSVLPESDVL